MPFADVGTDLVGRSLGVSDSIDDDEDVVDSRLAWGSASVVGRSIGGWRIGRGDEDNRLIETGRRRLPFGVWPACCRTRLVTASRGCRMPCLSTPSPSLTVELPSSVNVESSSLMSVV